MDIQPILVRRGEVEQQIAQHKADITQLEQELIELETAVRVFERLSGVRRRTAGESDEPAKETLAKAKPEGLPTVREMIIMAINDANRRGLKGLIPKEMVEFIKGKYWPDMNPNQVYSNLSRMTNETNDLVKDEATGRYMLRKEKLADGQSAQDASASLFSPQRDRKAGPGGGTK